MKCRVWVVVWLLIAVVSTPVGWSSAEAWRQDDEQDALAAEAERQARIAERFWQVLKQNPRRGTALDRVYGHHVEYGTLEDLLSALRLEVSQAPDDGTGWMLLGLLESQRGEDGNAVDAFQRAESLRADDALASYYLGHSLLMVGLNDAAVDAFERSIEREPARTDLLEVFQTLGRVHQRAQRTEEAMQVWTRLEEMYPDDPRVLEQIAVTLTEEGQHEEALTRFRRLVELSNDDYRRSTYRIEVAHLLVRSGQRERGIAEFESLLSDLNPEGWLYQDIRRRVEDVFLRSGDQDGLVQYYESWIASHQDDIDAMARLARFLANSARMPEANSWMEKAIERAPTRVDLRRSYISLLIDQQEFTQAIQQFELLSQAAPGDVDVLRDWGKTILRDRSLTEETQIDRATEVWQRIVEQRPEDALTHVQVADLLRQNKLNDQAIELYANAIELAPADPQYREYLGEFYHQLQEPDKALATWKPIAEGERRTATNLSRLAEVLNGFGYHDLAVESIAEAAEKEPNDLSLLVKASEYHRVAKKYDEALAFVDRAEQVAQNIDEEDAVLTQRIEVLRSSRQLADASGTLKREIESSSTPDAQQWRELARMFEADRRWLEAAIAIDKARSLQPDSIPVLTTAQSIAEQSGDYGTAAELAQRLADVDRRARGDHLMNVARLQAQLGRSEEALQAGRDLIASAPGNTDHYEYYAQLCGMMGKQDEALDALRKAVRINPTEPRLMAVLAQALADQFRTKEAIEVFWRAYETASEIDDRVNLITKQTDLYLQINQFEQLVERLEREKQEDETRRLATICLAQAHHTAGDYGSARMELESLLVENTRDTELLQQLSKLCEAERDLEDAIDYQRQLVTFAPSYETEFRLAKLLQQVRADDEAVEIITRLTLREEDPVRLLRGIDAMIGRGTLDAALSVTDSLLRSDRNNWELLYREASLLCKLDREDEARTHLDKLLSLDVALDELGSVAEDDFQRSLSKAKSDLRRGRSVVMPQRPDALSAYQSASRIMRDLNLGTYAGYGISGLAMWTPSSYAEARMGAHARLMVISGGEDEQSAYMEKVEQHSEANPSDRKLLYDVLNLRAVRGETGRVFEIAKALAENGTLAEKRFYLSTLETRKMPTVTSRGQTVKQEVTPLSDAEIELMLACYQASREVSDSSSSGFSQSVVFASNGQAYVLSASGSYVPYDGASTGSALVLTELKRAGYEEKAEELLQREVENADSVEQINATIRLCITTERFELLDRLVLRWSEVAPRELVGTGELSPTTLDDRLQSSSLALTQAIDYLFRDGKSDQSLDVLDSFLNVAEERFNQRRATRTGRSQQLQVGTRQQLVLFKSGKSWSTTVSYPHPNEYLPASLITILRQVYMDSVEHECVDKLRERLERRVSDSAHDNQAYQLMLLGSFLWWNEEQDEAILRLEEAGELIPTDARFRLELALLHFELRDVAAAMKIVDSVQPRDQGLLKQREILAMSLSEQRGDVERARDAAERLFGLRLTMPEQVALAERMRRLGLSQMAQAVVSRMRRRAGSSIEALYMLMAQYQAEGQVEVAQEIAHTILRRTPKPASLTVSGSMSSLLRSASISSSSERIMAIQVLYTTGGLETLTAQLEKQIEQSPESLGLYEQLIEFYQATNETDKAAELLQRAVESKPDDMSVRLQVAMQLRLLGKGELVGEHLIAVLDQEPELFVSNLNYVYNLTNSIENPQQLVTIGNALLESDLEDALKASNSSYYMTNLTERMVAYPESRAVGIKLLLKVADFSLDGNNTLSSFTSLARKIGGSSPELTELMMKAMQPKPELIARDPWFGFNSVRSYLAEGMPLNQIDEFQRYLQADGQKDKLRQTLSDHVEKYPNWLGGQALLASLEIASGNRREGLKILREILGRYDSYESLASDTCWLLAAEFRKAEEYDEVAIKLLKTASSNNTMGRNFSYSPDALALQFYKEAGRLEEAKEIYREVLKVPESDSGNSMAAYEFYRSTRNVSEMVSVLGMERELIQMYREMLQSDSFIEEAASVYSNASDQVASMRRDIEQRLEQAIQQIEASGDQERVLSLIVPTQNASKHSSAIDMLIMVSKVEEGSDAILRSCVIDTILSVCKNKGTRELVLEHLETLRNQRPQDLSVCVLLHVINDRYAQDQITSPAEFFSNWIDEDQPDGEADKGRLTTAHRRALEERIMLWFAARSLIRKAEYRETGRSLADASTRAALRLGDSKIVAAILIEWSKLELQVGEKQAAQAKLEQLLDYVTGEGPSPSADGETSSRERARGSELSFVSIIPSAVIRHQAIRGHRGVHRSQDDETTQTQAEDEAQSFRPPLTSSNCELALKVARIAAEEGMPELSVRAIHRALSAGPPVPDNRDPLSLTGNTRSPTSIRLAQPSLPTSSSIDELVRQANHVIQLWELIGVEAGDAELVLRDIVMPRSRAGEIILWVDSSSVQSGTPVSLISNYIHWAEKAGRLNEFSEQLDQHIVDETPSLSMLVCQVLVEIENGELEQAVKPLARLSQTEVALGESSLMEAAVAAIPAFDFAETRDAALPIFKKVALLEFSGNIGRNWFHDGFPELTARVSEYYGVKGDWDELEGFYQEMESRLGNTLQTIYPVDYLSSYQASCFASIASNAATLGSDELSEKYLARCLDTTVTGQYSMELDYQVALHHLTKRLARLSAEDRYTAWANWMLPTDTRRVFRLGLCRKPAEMPSASLATLSIEAEKGGEDQSLIDQIGVCSTIDELLSAAKEAGKLDELVARLESLHKDKIAFAEPILCLALLKREANQEVMARILEHLKELGDMDFNARYNNENGGYAITSYSIGSELIKRDETRQLGLIALGFAANWSSRISAEVQELAEQTKSHVDWYRVGLNPNNVQSVFRHWVSSTFEGESPGAKKARWLEAGGMIVGFGSSVPHQLLSRFPLSGDFRVDMTVNSASYFGVGYGGSCIELVGNGRVSVKSASDHEQVYLNEGDSIASARQPLRLSIERRDGKVSYWIDEQLVYDEPYRGGFDWLEMTQRYDRQVQLWDFRLNGEPSIPKSVPMISADSMDGWRTAFFGNRQPANRVDPMTRNNQNDGRPISANQNVIFDWRAEDGVLLGDSRSTMGGTDEKWAYYVRPLQPNESVNYEFFYKPGQMEVHPTFGRLAFLLEPTGIRTRRLIQDRSDRAMADRNATLFLDDESDQVGSQDLPLKEGEWNQVSLTYLKSEADDRSANSVVVLTLNDTEILRRPVPTGVSSHFGLFRAPQHMAQVRMLELSGPWASSLPAEDEWLAIEEQLPMRGRALLERTVASSRTVISHQMTPWNSAVVELMSKVRQAGDEEAYSLLHDWVLPYPGVARVRLACGRGPRVTGQAGSSHASIEPGERLFPAYELVQLAARLSRLDDLEAEVAAFDGELEGEAIERDAFLLLIAIAKEDDDQAEKLIQGMMTKITPTYEVISLFKESAKWFETLHPALIAACERPMLSSAIHESLEEWIDLWRSEDSAPATSLWHLLAIRSIAMLKSRDASQLTQEVTNQSQWAEMAYFIDGQWSDGQQASIWQMSPGKLTHIGREASGQLIYQSPLTGEFEIAFKRSGDIFQPFVTSYGLRGTYPTDQQRAGTITLPGTVVGPTNKFPEGALSEEGLDQWKIVVRENVVTTFVNDVEIDMQSLDSDPFPWIVIQAVVSSTHFEVSDLRIEGNPTIPEELTLIDQQGVQGWRGSISSVSNSSPNQVGYSGRPNPSLWYKSAEEISGPLGKPRTGVPDQALLQYRRPMLEDGEVEYEFYYEAGRKEVHPAIGPLAFMLERSGVALHWVPDNGYEPQGPTPDNRTPLAEDGQSVPVPLKEDDWNQLRIKLAGDQLEIFVNEESVAEVTLTMSPAERLFGLFRFPNQTSCRVRNIVYRGEWPKELPPISQQLLAAPQQESASVR